MRGKLHVINARVAFEFGHLEQWPPKLKYPELHKEQSRPVWDELRERGVLDTAKQIE